MTEPLYLSGPMSGLPEFNFPAFINACVELRRRGYTVFSPHEKGNEDYAGDESWLRYLRADIELLMQCRSIVLLPGWPSSRGAKLELSIALGLNMDVYFFKNGRLMAMGLE